MLMNDVGSETWLTSLLITEMKEGKLLAQKKWTKLCKPLHTS